jgi:hypothetical protein
VSGILAPRGQPNLVAATLQLFDDAQQVLVVAAPVRHPIGEMEDPQGE